ncbi:hypothetical protein HNR67_006549 [Crossiella cryophila]|uniref:Uncharacterized protein n=1 Tax=Crossiella cryophila TaxID=43355 RepID=A0A7W7CIL1_9PSEU|nr:hypothetical protein [Crossiella cryophila]
MLGRAPHTAQQGPGYSLDTEVADLLAETGARLVFGHRHGGLIALETPAAPRPSSGSRSTSRACPPAPSRPSGQPGRARADRRPAGPVARIRHRHRAGAARGHADPVTRTEPLRAGGEVGSPCRGTDSGPTDRFRPLTPRADPAYVRAGPGRALPCRSARSGRSPCCARR